MANHNAIVESPPPATGSSENTEEAVWFLCGRLGQSDAIQYVAIESTPFRVGRRGDLALFLSSRMVSSVHAELHMENGELWLTDLDSTNGTFVNASRVTAPVRLKPDDLVQFGDLVFRVLRQVISENSLTESHSAVDHALSLVQFRSPDERAGGDPALPADRADRRPVDPRPRGAGPQPHFQPGDAGPDVRRRRAAQPGDPAQRDVPLQGDRGDAPRGGRDAPVPEHPPLGAAPRAGARGIDRRPPRHEPPTVADAGDSRGGRSPRPPTCGRSAPRSASWKSASLSTTSARARRGWPRWPRCSRSTSSSTCR